MKNTKGKSTSRQRLECAGVPSSQPALSPSSGEVMQALRNWRNTLVDSFTNHIGAHKGKITEPHIMREIECIDAGMKSLERLALYDLHRAVILKALWSYDTQGARAAYEAIHFSRNHSLEGRSPLPK